MQTKIKELLARVGPYLVVALVCLALGYYGGSRGQPDRVEERSHVEEKSHVEEIGEVKAAERIREDVKTRKQVTRVKKRVEFRPDGTKASETTTTTGVNTDVTRTGTTDRQSDTQTAVEGSSVTVKDLYKLTDNRRNWRLSVLLGAQLRNPGSIGSLATGATPFNALVVGISAEARLGFIPKVGDHLWVGVWALANPQQMAIAHDPLNYLNVGLSLGVEF